MSKRKRASQGKSLRGSRMTHEQRNSWRAVSNYRTCAAPNCVHELNRWANGDSVHAFRPRKLPRVDIQRTCVDCIGSRHLCASPSASRFGIPRQSSRVAPNRSPLPSPPESPSATSRSNQPAAGQQTGCLGSYLIHSSFSRFLLRCCFLPPCLCQSLIVATVALVNRYFPPSIYLSHPRVLIQLCRAALRAFSPCPRDG